MVHGFQVKGDAARSKSAEGQMIGKLSGVSKIKGNEKEPGQWNKYDITFSNGDLTLIVNGEKVNEATGCDVMAGKIGLQSEGGEIHFRTVRLISFENKVSTAKDTKPSVQIPKPGIQVNAAKEVTLGTGDSAEKATVHYLISLPENYNEQDKCPLLIFLHGRGECGNDLNRVKVHGPPKIVKKKNTTPFVIVSPQCPKRESWRIEKLSKLLDHILATTKADPERVYLTGLSLGGFGTWGWAAQEPKRFAAAIPICGGGNPDAAEKLVKLPIWAFHGGKDTVVSLSRSEAMVEAIKKTGGTEVKLTIYPEAGHDSWTKTYNNPEIYKWLLTHKADDVVTNSIGMKLVYIPAGSFVMGSKRQHQVRISKGFWMGQTEVTQGQYKSVMNAQPWSGKPRVQEDANNPAVYVSWDDAVEFCSKLSQQEGKTYRLPTEAEWEYACRAGTTTRFSFGDSYSSLGDYAWFRDNTHRVDQKYAHAVGQKKPNPWGIYDMHGNVFEWCSDYYDKGYYSNSPSVDPNGPSSGISRCLRGGSWIILVGYLRSYHRYGDYPGFRHCSVGFRFVRSQP